MIDGVLRDRIAQQGRSRSQYSPADCEQQARGQAGFFMSYRLNHEPRYEPTPAEIAEAAAKERENWTEDTLRKRAGLGQYEHVEVMQGATVGVLSGRRRGFQPGVV